MTALIAEGQAHWSILADIEAVGTSLSNPDPENDIINVVKADRDIAWFPEFALDGSILGDIRSNGGNIGTIEAAAFIGAVNNAASSNTQTIETGGGNIGSIVAGSLGEVTIDCLGSSNGQVNLIETRAGGWGYDEGYETFLNDDIDFDPSGRPMGFTSGGSLIAGRLGALSLKGSLDSSLSIGSIVQSGTWKIGDSLGPNALISLRNGGLSGQIVINANGGDGEWLGGQLRRGHAGPGDRERP